MLNRQNKDRRYGNESIERGSELVIAGSDTAKSLESVEETLDNVAFFIDLKIIFPRFMQILHRGNKEDLSKMSIANFGAGHPNGKVHSYY